jgi:hypothetical protein
MTLFLSYQRSAAQSGKGIFEDISTTELIFLFAVNGKAKLVVRRGYATVSRSADPQGGDHHQHTRPEPPASIALRKLRDLRIKSSLNQRTSLLSQCRIP